MDPLSAAAAIAGILSAIKGVFDANATAQWQNEAAGKLNVIIKQNAAIISDLEQLPLLFAADLQDAFNREVEIQAISLNNDFDQYMSGALPDFGQIKSIRTPAELLANNIIQRGPCVYQSAGTVTVLVLAIHKILKVDVNETQSLINIVLSQMNAWSGNDNGMFGKAISDTSSILQQTSDSLAHEPRGTVTIYSEQVEVVLPGGPGGRGIHMHPILKVIADISIDDINCTFSVSNARSTWFDTTRFNDDVVAAKALDVTNRLQNEVNMIKNLRSKLNELQNHLEALQKIIASLKSWNS